jgi:23S rRNA pseudouridine1911/1915/1917 synthase
MRNFEQQIIHSDNHLLAVNKPPGMLTQPSPICDDSLESAAKQWIKETANKPGNVYLHAVHRLDRAASGVVLFARTSKALSRLQEQLRKKSWTKIYHALVEAEPRPESAELIHYLRHASHHAEVMRTGATDAKKAVLRYKLLRPMDRLYLVEIHLKTGRYHQIRAQLSAIGCPIAGDKRYGAKVAWPGQGIALHHRLLKITHPVTKESLRFETPYPTDWPL